MKQLKRELEKRPYVSDVKFLPTTDADGIPRLLLVGLRGTVTNKHLIDSARALKLKLTGTKQSGAISNSTRDKVHLRLIAGHC